MINLLKYFCILLIPYCCFANDIEFKLIAPPLNNINIGNVATNGKLLFVTQGGNQVLNHIEYFIYHADLNNLKWNLDTLRTFKDSDFYFEDNSLYIFPSYLNGHPPELNVYEKKNKYNRQKKFILFIYRK